MIKTVAELIQELQKYPEYMPVFIDTGDTWVFGPDEYPVDEILREAYNSASDKLVIKLYTEE